MADSFDIWVPVIVSSLLSYYQSNEIRNYPLHKEFKRIEMLKVKVKAIDSYRKGSSIEVVMHLEILILLEDNNGKTEMFRTEEKFRQKITTQEFNNEFDLNDDYHYIAEITNLNVNGDLHHDNISLTIRICFDIMVLKNRKISLANEAKFNTNTVEPLIPYPQSDNSEKIKLQNNINRLRVENQNLLRQLSIYEKDIISLKRGIQKAEARSFGWKRQNREYKKYIDDLHIKLKKVEKQLNEYIKAPELGYLNPPLQVGNARTNMYQKIKNIFLNIL